MESSVQVQAISVRDLVVEYSVGRQQRRALDGVTFEVEAGRVVGFLGPNGAGKTTTIQVLLGFVDAVAGSAELFGTDVRRSIARRRIGYLPELPDTYRFLTGREVLVHAGRLFDLGGAVLRERIDALLETVGLGAAADRRTSGYSRGMLQRLGLAQALINDPDLVILDEPTSGLDPLARQDVRRVIQDLRARGRTVFFSSHELSEIELTCDRVVLIRGGRVAAAGPVSALVAPGESLEQYFLKVCAPESRGSRNA